jgi:hypothetical protein
MAHKIFQFLWEYRLWAFFISVLGLFASVPHLITAWDVLWHRLRDLAVFDVLDRKVPGDTGYGGKEYYPLSVQDISRKLERSEKSVFKSLKRLKKGKMGDLVVESLSGWYSKANSPNN